MAASHASFIVSRTEYLAFNLRRNCIAAAESLILTSNTGTSRRGKSLLAASTAYSPTISSLFIHKTNAHNSNLSPRHEKHVLPTPYGIRCCCCSLHDSSILILFSGDIVADYF